MNRMQTKHCLHENRGHEKESRKIWWSLWIGFLFSDIQCYLKLNSPGFGKSIYMKLLQHFLKTLYLDHTYGKGEIFPKGKGYLCSQSSW